MHPKLTEDSKRPAYNNIFTEIVSLKNWSLWLKCLLVLFDDENPVPYPIFKYLNVLSLSDLVLI